MDAAMHLPGLPNPESLLHAAPDKARRCSATTFPLLMLVSVLFVLFWGTDYPRPLSLSFRRPAPATTRSMSSHRPLTQARIRALTPRSPTRAPFTISGSVSQPHATGRRTPVVPRVDAAATPSGIPIAAFVARVSGLSLGVLALWSWYQRRRPRKACPRARSTRAFACAAATAEDGGTRASKATGRVLVVGATGGCGRAAYHACLAQGFQDVRCLVRSRERGRSVLGDQAALVVGDATELHTLQAAMQGVTHVIICLGRRRKEAGSSAQSIDYQGTVNVLTASQAAGSVQRIVYVTSTSVDSPKKPFIRVLNLLGGMGLGWKLRAEQALRDSGIPYVVVRPVALKDTDADAAPLIKQCQPYEWGFCSISRAVVGQVCAHALTEAPGCVTLNCREQVTPEGGTVDLQGYDWAGELGALVPDAGPLPCSFEDHKAAVDEVVLWAKVMAGAVAVLLCGVGAWAFGIL